jgi:hypothetical protein
LFDLGRENVKEIKIIVSAAFIFDKNMPVFCNLGRFSKEECV